MPLPREFTFSSDSDGPRVEFIKIILLSTLSAILYGVAHDQVTIRVCPEYFTVGHPHLIATDSLTLLALAWGVAATWWVGLGLGILLGISARFWTFPKLTARDLACPLAVLLCAVGVFAVVVGYWAHHTQPYGAVIGG